MKIGAYTWPPHVILSSSLLPVSPCAAQFAVWRSEASRSSPPPCVVVVEGDPVFPAGDVAKSTTPLSRARHLPHFPLRLALLSFSFLCSPWTASEQLALVDRYREFFSMDSKSTSPEAPPRL